MFPHGILRHRILLFGIALIYGATGSFNLAAISSMISEHHEQNSVMIVAGILMMMIALAFKVSAAPSILGTGCISRCTNSDYSIHVNCCEDCGFAAFYRLFIHIQRKPRNLAPTLMIISRLTIPCWEHHRCLSNEF